MCRARLQGLQNVDFSVHIAPPRVDPPDWISDDQMHPHPQLRRGRQGADREPTAVADDPGGTAMKDDLTSPDGVVVCAAVLAEVWLVPSRCRRSLLRIYPVEALRMRF